MAWIEFEHAGERRRVAVADDERAVWIGWPGGALRVEAKQIARGDDSGAAASNSSSIEAPMTGKVVTVEVAAGDRVAVDQVVVVLEAMKMEFRLTAPRAGTVERVNCEVGALVEQGSVLVALHNE